MLFMQYWCQQVRVTAPPEQNGWRNIDQYHGIEYALTPLESLTPGAISTNDRTKCMNTTTRIEPGSDPVELEKSGCTTVLGHRVPRVDGAAKVTGSAIYGDDIKLPGMLYGVCRYTDIAAGKIVSIDTSDAEK
jgi:hypothetical protein